MAGRLTSRVIGFLVAPDGAEQVELVEPWQAVRDEGGRAALISLAPGEVQLRDHLDRSERWPVDVTLDRVRMNDFDALVLPGGVANPDKLRTDPRAVGFIRNLVESGRPVAMICHAPWLLIEADVVRGRTLTSYPSLRTDLINAGAQWVDQAAVVDERGPNTLVSSRGPGDLPAFREALIEHFSRQPVGAR